MRVDCERAEARRPRSAFSTGGFQTIRTLRPCGAPDSETVATGAPTSRSASSPGLAIVAEQRMKVGRVP
ncbi:MAG: hypothetical protein M5U08_10520 [Burkholderiales bacterium]|nr:hypothetical protein [Burkholderiales bacterium]